MKSKTKHIISYIVLALAIVALSISTIVLSVENNNKTKGLHNINNDTYDFYITLGTMPTLYATLNAYQTKNPNTYMWFYRGNTISKQYSADFIHYFSTQSDDNSNSTIDYWEIRDKVREICTSKPGAHFRLFCDDLRVRFIFDFINAGVDFENLEVTLLSDGTGTYGIYNGLTEEDYVAQKQTWERYVKDYVDHRNNKRYNKFIDYNGQAMEFQDYAFYVSTFSNVSYWVQSPDYLKNSTSETLQKERYNMNIVRKDPKAMYNGLDAETKTAYQKVVLANALVDSDTLHTLDEAVSYFDTNLSNRDKEVVLILGTNYNGLDHNEDFIDQTIEFYTPTATGSNNKAKFKGKEYDIQNGHITVEDKELAVGELAVYLYFKGHPAYPANSELQQYFEQKHITVLPHRTPVEVLFWLYDVKVGGYESTSFLSCTQGQAEFFYLETANGEMKNTSLKQMQDAGFFSNAAIFKNS